MTRSELILAISRRCPQLTVKDAEVGVAEMLAAMTEALRTGDRIEIRRFGTFARNFRPPRKSRNPKTGAEVSVQGKFVPHFRAGKELRERVLAAAPAASS